MQEETTSVDRSRDADSLRTAFGLEGCPVCTVVLDSMQRSMDTWQYEGFTDVEHRHELIKSKGFCPLHTWQLAQLNTPFQLAMVYQGVLTDVLSRLNRDYNKFASTDQSKSRRGFVWKGLWGRGRHRKDENSLFERCPLCRIRAGVEQRLIATLLELLHSEEMRALLSRSTGLCLLHFMQTRKRAEMHDPEGLNYLLECQCACVQRVLGEVEELIRKHDYRFID